MRIAIITGASSGMGREYTKMASARGGYDQIWVIARRREQLAELADECEADLRIVDLDLSQRSSIDALAALIEHAAEIDPDFEIGLLVNCAGFGKFATYADLSLDETDAMIDLNCRALVDITQLCLPHMKRGSRIFQFASSAGFQPLPGFNVYAASKSFVISYTRALRRELMGKGIHITAVCPLWIKTEFIQTARETKNGTTVKHPWPQYSPHRIAIWSSAVNKVNYPIATCSIPAFAMRVASKIIPSSLIDWIWEGLRRI